MTIENDIDFILEGIETAKQEAMKPLRELRDKYTEEGSDYEEAKKFVHKIANSEDTLGRYDVKNLITSVAIAHRIYCEVGDYGNGEFLVLEQYGASNYGVSIGDWISSSESC